MNLKAACKYMTFFRKYLKTLSFWGGGGEMLWIRKNLYIHFAFLQAILRMKLNVLYLERDILLENSRRQTCTSKKIHFLNAN